MNDIDKKLDILKTELTLSQGQMDKYDNLSGNVKSWVMTLWAAATGWAFSADEPRLFLVSIAVLIVFWWIDGVNKNVRVDYKDRRNIVAAALEHFYKTGELPEDVTSPVMMYHEKRGGFKHMFHAHVSSLYVALLVLSLALYLYL